MKKLTQTTVGFIAVLLMSLTFIQCKDSAVTKFMELQAEQINKQCPIEMGGGLKLKSCKVEGDKTFKYVFIMPEGIESFDSEAGKAGAIEALKNTPDFKQLKEFGISCHYEYYDAKDKLLGEIKITPEDYS